jgi:hypothetical protein
MEDDWPFSPSCDGLLMTWSCDSNAEAKSKTFTVAEIDSIVPANCYDFYDPEEDDNTPLTFLIQEYDEATVVSFQHDALDPFATWMTNAVIKDYAVWAEEEGLQKHLEHLAISTHQSATPPAHPLTVSFGPGTS